MARRVDRQRNEKFSDRLPLDRRSQPVSIDVTTIRREALPDENVSHEIDFSLRQIERLIEQGSVTRALRHRPLPADGQGGGCGAYGRSAAAGLQGRPQT